MRFSHIHVDLVGPLPPSANGCTHLLTIIDRTTRWPEAIPLASTKTADVAKALIVHWVSRFGVPTTLTSDRGSQFTSGLWSELCRFLNIRHSPTTAYHPEANGMVERLHRRLKDALRARAATAASWVDHIPWILLSLRAAPREDDGISPAERTYGSPLVVPGQFLNQNEIDVDTVHTNVNKI
jgi:transposase InsO family protein